MRSTQGYVREQFSRGAAKGNTQGRKALDAAVCRLFSRGAAKGAYGVTAPFAASRLMVTEECHSRALRPWLLPDAAPRLNARRLGLLVWRYGIPTCLALILATNSVAQELPETKKPYQLQVVLQIASNRVFTPLFQEQLQRDIQNQLKISFGKLAQIEVTRDHPLWREIEAKGLDAAFEGWESVSEATTHFVVLDYVAGTYQVQTRFHDGTTGQVGPPTSPVRIVDRVAVARQIAQRIEADFCPVGTVAEVGKTVTRDLKAGKVNVESVALKLRGSELGVKLNRWVQPGQVFAVSRLSEQAGKKQARPVKWALLEVRSISDAGVCQCDYWRRYQEDRLVVGDRALRIATTPGPIKVQLLDDTTLEPMAKAVVRVLRPDGDKSMDVTTNIHGVATLSGPFSHFAWIQVPSGGKVWAQFPVERIDGRTVVARVKMQTDRESLAPLEARRDAWMRRIYDNLNMSSERSRELSAQLNQSLEAALDAGKKSLPLLEAEIAFLDGERDELDQLAKEKKVSFEKDLKEGRARIDDLRKQAKELQAFVKRLEGVPKESVGLTKLVERARLLEAEAEYDQAIKLYEQVVQASPEQTKIQAHLDQLRKAWAIKGDAHEKARAFVYQQWSTFDVAGLQKNMKAAEDHVAACRTAGDKLTLQKMLRVNVTHTANLKKQLDTLKQRESEDNRTKAKTVVQITEALLRLHTEASAFVGTRKE